MATRLHIWHVCSKGSFAADKLLAGNTAVQSYPGTSSLWKGRQQWLKWQHTRLAKVEVDQCTVYLGVSQQLVVSKFGRNPGQLLQMNLWRFMLAHEQPVHLPKLLIDKNLVDVHRCWPCWFAWHVALCSWQRTTTICAWGHQASLCMLSAVK